MNTYAPYTDITETFIYPDAPDASTAKVTVTYEFGDTVVAEINATQVSGNQYSVAIGDELTGAAGIYRIKWSCEFSDVPFHSYTTFAIEGQYISEEKFMQDFPEFNTADYIPKFAQAEKVARSIIDTFCGQSFQSINNKTLTIDGNGRDKLHVPLRINNLNQVNFVDSSGSADYTTMIEIDPMSRYFLRVKKVVDSDGLTFSKFPKSMSIVVKGDWGWLYIPRNIELASELLIADLLEDVRREHKRYGIVRLWQDTQRFEFDSASLGTTGNTDVDVLLMDYVYWTLDYVSE